MLRRIILALIGLLAVVNGSKWLFDGKRLQTLVLEDSDKNNNKNYYDVISINLHSFQQGQCYITISQSKCGKQVELNIDLSHITSN